ncbi:MAG TPA: hypothetical protein VIK78_04935 [Ruminiclostridium sp.]
MKDKVIKLKLQEIVELREILKADDEINVVDNLSKRKKNRERAGKIISVNERFITVNFGKYKESLDVFKINHGFIKVVKA